MKERGGVGHKLLSESKSQFDELIEIIGGLPVKTISKENNSRFKKWEVCGGCLTCEELVGVTHRR